MIISILSTNQLSLSMKNLSNFINVISNNNINNILYIIPKEFYPNSDLLFSKILQNKKYLKDIIEICNTLQNF